MVRAVLVVVLALVLLSLPALGEDTAMGRATLKGLPGVHAVVREFDKDSKRAGFHVGTFQTDVELKLRMAGIKVLSEEESFSTPAMPLLVVQVHCLAKEPGQRDACSLGLEFQQAVSLNRAPKLNPFQLATTWSVMAVAVGDAEYIRDRVKDLMDIFVNAWLSVNPKE